MRVGTVPIGVGPQNFDVYTVTTSAARIVSEDTAKAYRASGGIIIVSDSGNSGTVYLGDADTVTGTSGKAGIPLVPGGSVVYSVDHPSKIFALSSAGGQKLIIQGV